MRWPASRAWCRGLSAATWPGHLDGTDAVSAGFLGAVFAGLLAGYMREFREAGAGAEIHQADHADFDHPDRVLAGGGLVMLKVVGPPIAELMKFLGAWLASLSGGNAVVLGAILGAMIAFDMGGPINKTAFFFGAAMIKEGNYFMMGACAAAICTPPLGLGLATMLNRKAVDRGTTRIGGREPGHGHDRHHRGRDSLRRGRSAAGDPVHHARLDGGGGHRHARACADHAPHGGPIVLPVVDNRIAYVVAIVAGTLVTRSPSISSRTFSHNKLPLPHHEHRRRHRLPHRHRPYLYGRRTTRENRPKALGHQIKVETQGAHGRSRTNSATRKSPRRTRSSSPSIFRWSGASGSMENTPSRCR